MARETLPERDWRLLRSVHGEALDRYCARVLEECATVIRDTKSSSHDRYLKLFRLVKERDDSIAVAFNDLRRSTAIQRLASMLLLGTVTDEELSQFSVETRESATALADIWRPPGKPRKKS
jgi:hypothetical protein